MNKLTAFVVVVLVSYYFAAEHILRELAPACAGFIC